MSKKLLIYFLLFNFLNTVFFWDSDPEDYKLFNQGENFQEEEINSVVEYVVEECLDIKDATPEDEDDDWDDPFKTEKTEKYTPEIVFFSEVTPIVFIDVLEFSEFYNSTFNKVFLEINSPPPKVA